MNTSQKSWYARHSDLTSLFRELRVSDGACDTVGLVLTYYKLEASCTACHETGLTIDSPPAGCTGQKLH